jgi:hypothetical protein
MTPQQKSMSFVWMTWCLAALSGCFGGTAAAQPAPKPSLTITPSSPIDISGPQGGPFSPPSFQYHLSASTGTIRFVIAAPFWLTADPRAGTVGTDGVTVTFSPNPQALKLVPRGYEAPVTFTNVTNGQGSARRTAKLTIKRSTATAASGARAALALICKRPSRRSFRSTEANAPLPRFCSEGWSCAV